ncbi:PilW family protein [Psychrobacter sp. 16-Bac2893]|tara:strand:+ start:782 stop:1735 length:954 start_codon:yes stop_codon:yes gene_type:complete
MSAYHNKSYPSTIQGFTLIELMISLVLGLLISAAVIQVYIISTRTLTVQQSASEVQDSTVFALQAIDDHVRIANLGNPITNITDASAHGGVVLTGNNIGNSSYANTGYLTVSAGQTGTAGTNGWTGVSNTGTASDQLTIQYKNITPNDLYDCEGGKVDAGIDQWVIERYFVRLATNATAKTGVQDLVLACDAGRVDSANVVSGFGDNGEVIVSAIDQFQVLLGTLTDISQLTYLPAKTYLELTDKPAITTVKLGVIVRSNTPLITDADKSQFTVLGNTQTLKTDSERKKYYRRSYESTVLLRNARVMSVTGLPSSVQ